MSEDGAFPEKKIATKAKHLILDSYIASWGGIILYSMRGRRISRPLELCYIDTCCGAGVYEVSAEGDASDALGSPVIALKQLKRLAILARELGIPANFRAMFINTRQSELGLLQSHVESEGEGEVRVTYELGEFACLAQEAAAFSQGTFGLALIDPYGPSAIPYEAVKPLIDQPHNDCIVHFATNGLKRWAGSARKPDAERTPDEQKIVDMGTAFFGADEWIRVARDHGQGEKCEDALVELYRSVLRADGVSTLSLPLLFSDQNQTKYHLVFTCNNIAGLAKMKEVFQKGDLHQHYLRHRQAMNKATATHGPMLFEPKPELEAYAEVDQQEVERTVMATLGEDSPIEFQEILGACIGLPNVLEKHVRKALTKLRQTGKISYQGSKPKYHDKISLP